MKDNITIYPAAALFSGRETLFNIHVVDGLEARGYTTLLPQRDGFEFVALNEHLQRRIEPSQVEGAVQRIIYLLDMGLFIPKSDVIVANLDEPQDEGVMIELAHARHLGKVNVGYRTDVRTPYGSSQHPLRGIHFFPAFQCDYFVPHFVPAKSGRGAQIEIDGLVEKIHEAIVDSGVKPGREVPHYSLQEPRTRRIVNYAGLLFNDLEDLHSPEGLDQIAQRYAEYKDLISEVSPAII